MKSSDFSTTIHFFELFIFKSGRIKRNTFFLATLSVWLLYLICHTLGFYVFNSINSLYIIPFFIWAQSVLSIKRYHDQNKSGFHLAKILIPVIGQILCFYELFFLKGSNRKNSYGLALEDQVLDYHKNPIVKSDMIVDDVTQINPIKVKNLIIPKNISELSEIVLHSDHPISIGGGRFSMGGQTGSEESIHLDLRQLNNILWFKPSEKLIRVQAGTRWCDIQKFIDPHNLSIKIMQTYANFTVGGALSVNCHGRYVGLGPVIMSVKSILLITPTGSFECSRTQNTELFFGAVGCYGALGIIAEVELELADNSLLKRSNLILPMKSYHPYFQGVIKSDEKVVFHNGDLYPPHYNAVNAVSWSKTDESSDNVPRLQSIKREYAIEKYAFWLMSESLFGKFYRRYVFDKLLFLFPKKHWRNYEAGHDVLELEPNSRKIKTYVLQEYFIPVNNFDKFVPLMKEIFNRHNVNVINVSIRHAEKDPGSYLAWAKEEMYAFVVYYKQKTDPASKEQVAIWTRELINAALSVKGSYYVPYQPHGTYEQFMEAYPEASRLFDLKNKTDPDFLFKNVLWNKYYTQYQGSK